MTDSQHPVLDASALLALLQHEDGWDVVAAAIGSAAASSVNLSEVIQKAGQHGIEVDGLAAGLEDAGLEAIPFDVAEAEAAARLWLGGLRTLSLGDRACIATAQLRGSAVITADRAWADLDLPVTAHVIR